jgi:hypothetical protein
MDYERLISPQEIHQLPVKRLLRSASQRAKSMSGVDFDHFFCIGLPNNETAVVNANRAAADTLRFVRSGDPLPTPRSEITIDVRCLFGLLTGIYHWDTADTGSQYFTRRVPNVFNRQVQYFLNFLYA